MLHIYAATAQQERELHARRAAAKERGVRLGRGKVAFRTVLRARARLGLG